MTHVGVPRYWMDEESGVLAPVIGAYLARAKLSGEQIGIMRAYLKQWIEAPGFVGVEIDELRADVDELKTREDVALWLLAAIKAGVDPL